ncbi:3-isopropylmalate dehydrogenase [Exophiala aquamarina CBS 119918]|uniref:3-isopropylmalate dehydrogenase n=1 Tax=Exophiala aquamarina CBS 119918 TaxID=1182545 RepID=A0A072NW74_9EURO|nr:3-isopropylmalate dehydrogenase [Exophiala aquamarina CBS 119918]KEF51836.1 3-isopropylmalate dehydrogenase [Exophiala aquamarina CBS 119918]
MASTKTFRLLVLPGDHVGPEIVHEAIKVLRTIESCRPELHFELTFELAGGCSIDKHGVPITPEVLDKAKASNATLFGSVGGPRWGHAIPNPESALLSLRQYLNAFANIRPCEFFVSSLIDLSPIKREIVAGTKFVVVRENCGGAYFGEKTEQKEYASDLWGYGAAEVERLCRVSAAVARILGREGDGKGSGGPAVVWSSDKANVLANSRLWRRVTSDVFALEFKDIELHHQLADSMAMLMVQDPKRFNGVIHTDNTFGDILSDISGGIIGTLGVLPSASVSGVPGEGACNGIYEPVHGSAPDIAGKGVVNPVAQILSLAMLLRYSLGLLEEATKIEKAVAQVMDENGLGGLEIRTADLGGKATTSNVGDAVCDVLRSIL